MNAQTRRKEILDCLKGQNTPISASKLAQKFGVSRQVIVQDVALLRASGVNIASLARGYVLDINTTVKRVFKIYHSDEDVEKELNLIVDLGGTVEDVFVFHKVYGTVRADMSICSRRDVKRFIEDIKSGKSSLLKNVTSGYHYHTVEADSIQTLDIIQSELEKENFLAPLQEFEPNGVNR